MSVGKIKPKAQYGNDTLFMCTPKHHRNSDRQINIAGILELSDDIDRTTVVDDDVGDGMFRPIRRKR